MLINTIINRIKVNKVNKVLEAAMRTQRLREDAVNGVEHSSLGNPMYDITPKTIREISKEDM